MVEVGPDGTAGGGDEYMAVMNEPAVGATFADLLEYRIRAAQTPAWRKLDDGTDPTRLVMIQQEMRKLLPRDLAAGRRLDINRPLGNGRDDNNNGVVDEPGEWNDKNGNGSMEPGEQAVYWASADPNNRLPDEFTIDTTGQMRFDALLAEDRNLDQVIDSADRTHIGINGNIDSIGELEIVHNLERQMLARDIFLTALTLVDPYSMTTAEGKAKTRQLAQWAINVVDQRDPDNIMTAFEYDENPFDGWTVDNSLATTEPMQRAVVWGMERPELLITETLAFHDLLTDDEADELPDVDGQEFGDLSSTKDDDLDQPMKPRGAFFVELYNPNPSNPAANADTHDLDVQAGTNVDRGIALSAVDAQTGNSPVWRLMVYRASGIDKDPDSPETTQQPSNPDRSVYFTDFDPETVNGATWSADGQAFYRDSADTNAAGDLNVRPGRYMVVGGGRETTPGTYEMSFADPKQGPGGSLESRKIILDTTGGGTTSPVRIIDETGIVVMDNAGNFPKEVPAEDTNLLPLAFPGDTSNFVTDVAVINAPRTLSISEPAQGYPTSSPNAGNPVLKFYGPDNPAVAQAILDIYPDGFYGTSASSPKPIDVPLDQPGVRYTRPDGEFFSQPETKANFRWVYLQRLANPLLPFDKDTNPYQTVDTTSTDLTVVNGRATPTILAMRNALSKQNQDAGGRFYSVERGWRNNNYPANVNIADVAGDPVLRGNPWAMENPAVNPGDPTPLPPPAMRPTPQRETPPVNNAFNMLRVPDCTLGFLNRPFFLGNAANRLVPTQPMPWVSWNNRPYANAGELLQVPTVRSSQFAKAFSLKSSNGTGLEEVYDANVNANPMNTSLQTDGRYGHLVNFFRQEEDSNNGIAGMYRLLDYLHVASPYVGTETWLNPAAFGQPIPADPSNQYDPRYDPRRGLQPPFNRVSEYREPGRVNLNTVINPQVYQGLMHSDNSTFVTSPQASTTQHPGPFWDGQGTTNGLVDSRRGYGTPAQSQLQLEDASPTFFANPFRAADQSEMVPLGTMVRAPLDATLLRSTLGTAGATPEPMGDPLFAAETASEYNNADRNPYFRYQPAARMSSMTTNRSNVYAVWVTVGFFEVEEAPSIEDFQAANDPSNNLSLVQLQTLYEQVYPEGYQFGEEAGSATGDLRRVREFAIIDRTVPVAFEPGQDHNVDKAIRLRRRIE